MPNVWRPSLTPYLFIAPFFVLFAIFGAFPMVYNAWVSLHAWDLGGADRFVGLGNYRDLLEDPDFWNAVVNTMGMFIIATVPQLLAALGLATMLDRRLKAPAFFRVGLLIPIVTSVAAVAIVFSHLFARDSGLANGVLGAAGFGPVDWQAHRWSSWIVISTMVDWRWTGYNALIYLAAMQSVPRALYEAAAIDGAGGMRQFLAITLPAIRPAVVFTVIVSTIGGMQLFTEPLLFGQGDISGGSLRQFQTATMYMFEKSFRDFDYGYGAAAAWVIFLMVVLAALVNFLAVRRLNGSQG